MLDRIEINLLPVEYRVHASSLRRLKRQIVYPLLFDLLLVTICGLWIVLANGQVRDVKLRIAETDAAIAQNHHVQVEITRLEEARRIIVQKIQALERIDVNREKWVRLMETFAGGLPNQMWMRSIVENASAPGILEITGETYSFPEVASFMSRISQSSLVRTVDLINIEVTKGELRTYGYVISCATDAAVPDYSGIVQPNQPVQAP